MRSPPGTPASFANVALGSPAASASRSPSVSNCGRRGFAGSASQPKLAQLMPAQTSHATSGQARHRARVFASGAVR